MWLKPVEWRQADFELLKLIQLELSDLELDDDAKFNSTKNSGSLLILLTTSYYLWTLGISSSFWESIHSLCNIPICFELVNNIHISPSITGPRHPRLGIHTTKQFPLLITVVCDNNADSLKMAGTKSTGVVPTGPIEDVNSKPHPTSSKLEDQAATAALYVTQYDRQKKGGQDFLDKDHKLSSAGKWSHSDRRRVNSIDWHYVKQVLQLPWNTQMRKIFPVSPQRVWKMVIPLPEQLRA